MLPIRPVGLDRALFVYLYRRLRLRMYWTISFPSISWDLLITLGLWLPV